jgi:seryl-tRNA synthetase
LKSQLDVKETELLNILYQLPNIPNELVKSGASADDNEIIFQSHDVEGLGEGAIPHWELAKNITLLILN